MLYKTQRILKKFPFIIFLTLCFSLFSKAYLLGNARDDQRKIINDLELSVHEFTHFRGCTYTLFEKELHKEYYDNIGARRLLIDPLWKKLNYGGYYEGYLDYFYHFSELKQKSINNTPIGFIAKSWF
jgi:hypothetical protein